MLNTLRGTMERHNLIFYLCLACFVNTSILNMYVSNIQDYPGGILYKYACGCVTGIREYRFNA